MRKPINDAFVRMGHWKGGEIHVRLDLAGDGGYLLADGLRVIFSWGMGWDHVSVSYEDKTPTWLEMEAVKRCFFKDTETVMQLHVPPSDHINYHPFCLHLWRPQRVKIPRPPSIMIGPQKERKEA